MKYFFDTEFIEWARKLDPISIGIVSEDSRTLYHINMNCQFVFASEWVRKNVISQLPGFGPDGYEVIGEGLAHFTNERFDKNLGWLHSKEIAAKIVEFVGDDKNPEFWADYAAYDWVVFCTLFGGMLSLPKHFPMFVMDLQQFKSHLGITTKIPIPELGEHNALSDALTLKLRYDWLALGRVS